MNRKRIIGSLVGLALVLFLAVADFTLTSGEPPSLYVHRVPFSALHLHLNNQGEVFGLSGTEEESSNLYVWKPGEEVVRHKLPIKMIMSFFANERGEVIGKLPGKVYYWTEETGLHTWREMEFANQLGLEEERHREISEDGRSRLIRHPSGIEILGINDRSQLLVRALSTKERSQNLLVTGFPDNIETTPIFGKEPACGFTSKGWPFGRELEFSNLGNPPYPRAIEGEILVFDGSREFKAGNPQSVTAFLTIDEMANSSKWIDSIHLIKSSQWFLTDKPSPTLKKVPPGDANLQGQALVRDSIEGILWRFIGKRWDQRTNRTPIEDRLLRLIRPKTTWVYCDNGGQWYLETLLQSPLEGEIKSVLQMNERGEFLLWVYTEDGYQNVLVSPFERSRDFR